MTSAQKRARPWGSQRSGLGSSELSNEPFLLSSLRLRGPAFSKAPGALGKACWSQCPTLGPAVPWEFSPLSHDPFTPYACCPGLGPRFLVASEGTVLGSWPWDVWRGPYSHFWAVMD